MAENQESPEAGNKGRKETESCKEASGRKTVQNEMRGVVERVFASTA